MPGPRLVQATLRRWAPRASLRWDRKEQKANKDQGKKTDQQADLERNYKLYIDTLRTVGL